MRTVPARSRHSTVYAGFRWFPGILWQKVWQCQTSRGPWGHEDAACLRLVEGEHPRGRCPTGLLTARRRRYSPGLEEEGRPRLEQLAWGVLANPRDQDDSRRTRTPAPLRAPLRR